MKSMTKAQQKFLMVTLPAFIVREQGRGFAMAHWKSAYPPGRIVKKDGLKRRVPSCGMVACIGGSAVMLLEGQHKLDASLGVNEDELAVKMGLSWDETQALFYGWEADGYWTQSAWPEDFQRRFKNTKTTIGKARIAAELCKLVGKTKGACLCPSPNPSPSQRKS